MLENRIILFVGGGSGGHIFPNLAVMERLDERRVDFASHFVVSQRPLDAAILTARHLSFTALPVAPLTWRPWRWPAFFTAWIKSIRAVRRRITEANVVAVVATGGFVSGPAVLVAHRLGLPIALVNLDSVPGKATRALARRVNAVFTAYEVPGWEHAMLVGLPLLQTAVSAEGPVQACRDLGFDPDRHTLLVVGGSQGARSLNRMMSSLLAKNPAIVGKLTECWQVLHLAGRENGEVEFLRQAYQQAGVPARVMSFCDSMGLAWAAATLAISRAGAGSVAEAWVNAVPTIFMPYPFHRDQHQKHNSEPLVKMGAALRLEDRIDPDGNVEALAPRLIALMTNGAGRQAMRQAMRENAPGDGADVVAAWLAGQLTKAGPNREQT